jgi:ribosome biogenesis protein SSF1/2
MPKRGGKRTKKRTHVVETDETEAALEAATGEAPVPRSMVLRAPKAKLPHLLQVLQQELRKIMSPNTALKLKERKFNSLKDYTHVAGLLKVTHLMLLAPGGKRSSLSSSEAAADAAASSSHEGFVGSEVSTVTGAGALLKVGRLPQGPTLTFRIERYSLMRQVRTTQKRTYDVSTLYEHAPLVVLNNFGASEAGGAAAGASVVPPHVKLMRITFQNMFPPLDVATVRLADCR